MQANSTLRLVHLLFAAVAICLLCLVCSDSPTVVEAAMADPIGAPRGDDGHPDDGGSGGEAAGGVGDKETILALPAPGDVEAGEGGTTNLEVKTLARDSFCRRLFGSEARFVLCGWHRIASRQGGEVEGWVENRKCLIATSLRALTLAGQVGGDGVSFDDLGPLVIGTLQHGDRVPW